MKKLSILPSVLLVLTIMTLGLTSCSRKYGCYYSLTPEVKIHRNVDASKWISTSDIVLIDEFINRNNCDSVGSTTAN